jgi:hypothetical protein
MRITPDGEVSNVGDPLHFANGLTIIDGRTLVIAGSFGNRSRLMTSSRMTSVLSAATGQPLDLHRPKRTSRSGLVSPNSQKPT